MSSSQPHSNRAFYEQLLNVAAAIEDAMDENTVIAYPVDNAIRFPVNLSVLFDVNPFEFRGDVTAFGKFFEGKAG